MITVEKVMKHNGELCMTRKHAFAVADEKELEAERDKLQKHYGMKIYFIRKEKETMVCSV